MLLNPKPGGSSPNSNRLPAAMALNTNQMDNVPLPGPRQPPPRPSITPPNKSPQPNSPSIAPSPVKSWPTIVPDIKHRFPSLASTPPHRQPPAPSHFVPTLPIAIKRSDDGNSIALLEPKKNNLSPSMIPKLDFAPSNDEQNTNIVSSRKRSFSGGVSALLSPRGKGLDKVKADLKKAFTEKLASGISISSMRAHYWIYEWLCGVQTDSEDALSLSSISDKDRSILIDTYTKSFSTAGGGPQKLMMAIRSRLEVLIKETAAFKQPSLDEDSHAWLDEVLIALNRLSADYSEINSFLHWCQEYSATATKKAMILEAVGGQEILDLLKKIQSNPRHFIKNKITSYLAEDKSIEKTISKLCLEPLAWNSNSLHLLDDMDLEQSLRGVCTNSAVVFDSWHIVDVDCHRIPIVQPNGTSQPIRQPLDYGIADQFQGQGVVIRDLITNLKQGGYCPSRELDSAILQILDESLSSVPKRVGLLPSDCTFNTSQPGPPSVKLLGPGIFEVRAAEKIEIQHASGNDKAKPDATQLLQWTILYDQNTNQFTPNLEKTIKFEDSVPEEDRAILEFQASQNKGHVAHAIARALQKASEHQPIPISIEANVQRILKHKMAGCSRVICALSNGGFGPGGVMHAQVMNVPKKYKLQALQGRSNIVRILSAEAFEVTAHRKAGIFFKCSDGTDLLAARQKIKWQLTCNEKDETLSGLLFLDLTFEPWVPQEEREKILQKWQEGLNKFHNVR